MEVGYRHCIALSHNGKVWCWGWGRRGQMGNGGVRSELRPKLVDLGKI